jgi:hypothetical protein
MAYAYQNYSDDYNLTYIPTEGGSTPGKKILQFPEVNHIQGVIRVRGNTRLPQGNQVITIQASLSQLLAENIPYKGVIQDKGQQIIEGQKSRSLLSSKTILIGSKIKSISESVEIKGKKDYIVLIDKIKQLVNENL